jgi:transposase-like protein
MKTTITAPNYKGFRFPPEIISHTLWLYFHFSLSFRDVEELVIRSTLRAYLFWTVKSHAMRNEITTCSRQA